MAFDYQTLVGPKSTTGSIRSWLNYEPLDVEGILLDAQSHIYGALRVREMKTAAPVNLAIGASSAALPSDFLDPIVFTWNDTGERVTPTEPGQMQAQLRSVDGKGNLPSDRPGWYAIWDEAFQFDTRAAAVMAGTVLYYKRPAALSGSVKTNFLTTRYSNLLRAACLMFAADMVQDDTEYARWDKRTSEILSRISVESDLALRGAIYPTS